MQQNSDTDKLYQFLFQALDDENAADLETFGENFLQNTAVWDAIADHFPNVKPSEIKRVMVQAFADWQASKRPN